MENELWDNYRKLGDVLKVKFTDWRNFIELCELLEVKYSELRKSVAVPNAALSSKVYEVVQLTRDMERLYDRILIGQALKAHTSNDESAILSK